MRRVTQTRNGPGLRAAIGDDDPLFRTCGHPQGSVSWSDDAGYTLISAKRIKPSAAV
ncbi:MAG: hypothetical protein R3A47_02335 [Polyangiales bacterium]